MMFTSYPVLYSFRRCPYAMRARLALLASAQMCELREVALGRKPQAMLQASVKGTVPVLVLPNGEVVDQSLEIMLWALRRHDPQHWLQSHNAGLQDDMQLIAQCDSEFKFHLDRYKYPNRFDLRSGNDHRDQGAVFLEQLNTRLAGRHCLSGDREGLTDAAIAPFVRQFAHTDPTWFASQPWTALQAWLTTFEKSPAFAQIMEKHAPWGPSQAPVLFPAVTAIVLVPGHTRA